MYSIVYIAALGGLMQAGRYAKPGCRVYRVPVEIIASKCVLKLIMISILHQFRNYLLLSGYIIVYPMLVYLHPPRDNSNVCVCV